MENMTKEELIALLEQFVVVDEKTGIVYRRDENDILVPMENVTINNNKDGKYDKYDELSPLNQYIDGLSVDRVHHCGTTLCYQRYEKWCKDTSIKPVAMNVFVVAIMERMGMSKKLSRMTVVAQGWKVSLYKKPDNFDFVVGEPAPTGEKGRFTYFVKE